MGLRADFATVGKDIFDAFGDVILDCTLKKTDGIPTYDPATSQVTHNFVNYPLRAVLETFDVHEVDGDTIRVGDVKAITLQAEYPNGVEPSNIDEFIAEGKRYEIKDKSKDPANVLWMLHLRGADQ